ncbi:MAG: DUF4166 domain-containing protein [Pseudomonadota bacterium]
MTQAADHLTHTQERVVPISGTDVRRPLTDGRFRALLRAEDWKSLPQPVRVRFSQHLKGGESVVYAGELTVSERKPFGILISELARLIGAPLPLTSDVGVPSIVGVTEDVSGGGQNWSRLHCNKKGFPQAIHSAKRFSGPTGLEEFIAPWLSVALRVSAETGSLVFRSDHLALHILRRRVTLPRWLSPGDLIVKHTEIGNGRFRFSLELTSRVLGRLFFQEGIYREERT